MGYKLCTAEKPSVAKDIAKVIDANERKDGYFIGNGYIVTWCIGHLVTLAEPEEYGEEYKDRNNLSLLPIIPKQWKTTVIENVKKQFYIVKELMHRPDVDQIIDCGDMGETGHYLQWLVRMQAGCTKPVKRFCATSLTEEAIRNSMSDLRDIKDFEGIIKGAFCKAKSDYIIGMSFSRLFSTLYKSNLTVGRVQSPTLYFVVKRFMEVNNFKPTDYYQLEADFHDNFKAYFLKDNNNLLQPNYKDNDNRINSEAVANKLANLIKTSNDGIGQIVKLETKNKSNDRPQLYDITELERDGNRLYGYTASQVLQTAQSLYETHKLLSYPRTDSRYITTDLEPYMLKRVIDISDNPNYKSAAQFILNKGLNIDAKIIDNSKVTDHHALIITEKFKDYDFNKLNEMESKILNLVITRMLVSFSDKYLYKETTMNVQFQNGIMLETNGKMPVNQGWKAIQKLLMGNEMEEDDESDNESVQLFPNLTLGQKVKIKSIEILKKKTISPKLHTEATLLTYMENAGSSIVDNKEYQEVLKGHGIGTQATRADIIKKLFDIEYVKNLPKGKTNYIIPTIKGINAVKVFPPELMSPKLTAEWETKIAMVADGRMTESQFMNEISVFANTLIPKYKSKVIEGLNFNVERENLGECPFCKGTVMEGKTNYYCSNKGCKFFLLKEDKFYLSRTKKSITSDIMKKLLSEKSIVLTCVNSNDVKYKGSFSIVKNDSGYASFNFSFAEKKKYKKGKKKVAFKL